MGMLITLVVVAAVLSAVGIRVRSARPLAALALGFVAVEFLPPGSLEGVIGPVLLLVLVAAGFSVMMRGLLPERRRVRDCPECGGLVHGRKCRDCGWSAGFS